jgi:sulfur carrier protein
MQITIQLNGEIKQIQAQTTLSQLLDALGMTGKRIAIEKNGNIVPKSQHPTTLLQANDQIEIVVAVGGG